MKITNILAASAAILAGRRRWHQARDLADLADLNARWLAGEIAMHPSYAGHVDSHSDLTQPLRDRLIHLNKAGFLTRDATAGYVGIAYDSRPWVSHNAVTGLLPPAAAYTLINEAKDHGLVCIVLPGADALDPEQPHFLQNGKTQPGFEFPVSVAFHSSEPHTTYGRWATREDFRLEFWPCRRSLITELQNASQVIVYDPQPGSQDLLWDVLSMWANSR